MNLIVEREKTLSELERRILDLRGRNVESDEVRSLQEKYDELQLDIFGNLTPWERVHMARHPDRPLGLDYIGALDAFDELHGDRHFRDDLALVGGFAKLGDRRIMVLAQQKGRDTKEKIKRNFGMVTPEGYRKAKRLMELASRLDLPIVTFVDTSGADPGIGSEEHAQSEAIAQCLLMLTHVRVPVVSAIIGEGGSGGALALALADHVIMPQHSVYSVASPEGCAAILWGDSSRASEAAERLKLTSDDLLRFGIIDEILPEPLGGAQRDPQAFIRRMLETIEHAIARLAPLSAADRLVARYDRYRRIGAWNAASEQKLTALP